MKFHVILGKNEHAKTSLHESDIIEQEADIETRNMQPMGRGGGGGGGVESSGKKKKVQGWQLYRK